MSLPNKPHNDFNGDGFSDILWRDDDGTVTISFGMGDGQVAGKFLTTATPNWHIVGTGDFNGDGRADIVWRSDAGIVTEWLGQTDGSFLNNWANFTVTATSNWHIIGTGDFNGDGRDDILWRADDGTVTDWLGQSNGSFVSNGSAFTMNASSNWHVAATGDFNGDGRTDLLWRADDGTVTDWLAQADGSFANNWASFHVEAASNWQIATSAEMNGDGRDDIVWRADDGTVTDWLAQADGSFISNGANFTLHTGVIMTGFHGGYTTDLARSVIVGFGQFGNDGQNSLLFQDDTGVVWGLLFTTGGHGWHVEPEPSFL